MTSISFKDTILWNSTSTLGLFRNRSYHSGVSVSHCNFTLDSGCVYLKDYFDPSFTDAGNGDFSITPDSSCKDAGNPATTTDNVGSLDLNGNRRFIGTIDMGAFEVPGDYLLSVTKQGMGTIVSSPGGIDCGDVCSIDFADSAVTLTAVPDGRVLF